MTKQTDDNPRTDKVLKLKALRRLLKLMLAYPTRVFGAFLGVCLSALLTLSVGVAAGELVDGLFEGKSALSTDQLIIFISLFFFLLAIASGLRLYFIGWVGERVMADLRHSLHEHILRQPPAFFELRRTGDLLGRITTDSTVIQTLIVSTGSMALRNMLVVFFSIVSMLHASLILSAALFITLPLMMAMVIFCARRLRVLSRQSQEKIASVGSHTEQSLSGIRIIQAYGQEKNDQEKFSRKVEDGFNVAKKRLLMRALLTVMVLLSVIIGISLMIDVGIGEVKAGGMTPGDFTSFIYFAVLSAATSGVLSESLSDVMRAAGAADRIFDILASDMPVKEMRPSKHLVSPRGSLVLQNVTFTYPSGQKARALHQLNITIKSGEHVALVGPSGAGKSTVMLLLLRFYDPSSGSIMMDDIAIQHLPLKELRSQFAFIPQETTIFAGTLRDNLHYANPDAKDKELHDALAKSALAPLVSALPDGLNTEVGERGLLLSGGERQRLALARAFLRNPQVLLLDEPTSSLDSQNEAEVSQSLQALTKGRTSITIAHRLATVQNADRIIIMDKGKSTDEGTDAELMKSSLLYQQLKNLQFRTIAAKKT